MRKRDGYTAVYMRDGSCFCMALDAYESLTAGWMQGRAFLEAPSLYDAATVIKGEEVNGIARITADAALVARQDNEDEERDAALGIY